VREKHPTLVILDIHLPRLDGWSVLSAIKGDPSIASTPVIILSVEEQRSKGFSLGACEYLLKPVEPEKLSQLVRRAVAPGSGEVLVVDDDAATRELVVRQLKKLGFSTAEAADGEEALLRARVSPPALLILDLVMPTVDGFEVVRRMRGEGARTPIIVLTGKELDHNEQRQLRDGMARVVAKGGQALDKIVEEARRLAMEKRAVKAARARRILYVEDSPQNRDIVRRYLQDQFEILEAEDGEHGLHRAARELPDLILMDLSLPRIDGWECTRRILADPAMARIPVIALTAHSNREDQDRARKAGCVDFLTKPVERDVLLAAIQRHIGSPRLDA
jgi:CheY-like chemotaxis protein